MVPHKFLSDQSGFQMEMHSGRTLNNCGDKKIKCCVESVWATTHSYTIQPLISADGKLLSPLFIVLKETTRAFGQRVLKNILKPRNCFVTSSKSGKLNKNLLKTWFTKLSDHF